MSALLKTLNSEMIRKKRKTFGTAVALTDNTNYTAPNDGYVRVQYAYEAPGNNKCVYVYVNSVVMATLFPSQWNASITNVFVRKGAVVKVQKLTGVTTTITMNFYPLTGG